MGVAVRAMERSRPSRVRRTRSREIFERLPGAKHAFQVILAKFPAGRKTQLQHLASGPPARLRLRPAGEMLGDAVDQEQAPARVGGDDALAQGTQGHGELFFFIGQTLLGPLLLADIPQRHDDRLAPAPGHFVGLHVRRKSGAVAAWENSRAQGRPHPSRRFEHFPRGVGFFHRPQREKGLAGQLVHLVAGDPRDGVIDVQNVAGKRVEHDHHVGVLVEDQLELFLQVHQFVLGAGALAPLGRLPHLALDGRNQAREVGLHEVIVGAGAHDFHGGFLADAARDDDEGHVRGVAPRGLQRPQAVKMRQTEIRQDDVPVFPGQRGRVSLGGLHLRPRRLVAAAPEQAHDDGGVVVVVLHDQHAQRTPRGNPRDPGRTLFRLDVGGGSGRTYHERRGGFSLSTSQ